MPQDKADVVKTGVPAPERPPEVEKVPEAAREVPVREVAQRVEKPVEVPIKAPPAPAAPSAPPPPPKEPILAQIESILEEDLEEVYAGLPAELKPKFLAKGEEVARTIRQMMEQAKVKARKVLKLIIAWLKMIPGVNKFFLEQEAAIKTQKIMTITEEERKKQ